jgi:hypothetical protein
MVVRLQRCEEERELKGEPELSVVENGLQVWR